MLVQATVLSAQGTDWICVAKVYMAMYGMLLRLLTTALSTRHPTTFIIFHQLLQVVSVARFRIQHLLCPATQFESDDLRSMPICCCKALLTSAGFCPCQHCVIC